MAVLVGFHCAIINGKLAWRGVRRGSAEAGSSACGRVNAVGLTSILRWGQFFSSSSVKRTTACYTEQYRLFSVHLASQPWDTRRFTELDTVTDRFSGSGRAISLRFVCMSRQRIYVHWSGCLACRLNLTYPDQVERLSRSQVLKLIVAGWKCFCAHECTGEIFMDVCYDVTLFVGFFVLK